MSVHACADPENFVRGGPTCFSFSWWGEGGFKYHHDKRAIIGPPAKRHLNGVSLAWWWWPNIECWLCSFVIFLGIRTSFAKKPYIFVIFQVGVRAPCPPSGSAHGMWMITGIIQLVMNMMNGHPAAYSLVSPQKMVIKITIILSVMRNGG